MRPLSTDDQPTEGKYKGDGTGWVGGSAGEGAARAQVVGGAGPPGECGATHPGRVGDGGINARNNFGALMGRELTTKFGRRSF